MNVVGGYTTSYGRACNLSYTFDAVNALIQVTDADETRYNAALTCDANGNITQVVETYNSLSIPPSPESTLTTDFTYDALNRLTEHKTTRYVGGGVNKTQYTLRGHQYDATGRLAKSSYSQYYAGDMPSIASLEHVYDGARQVQNYDGVSAYGAVWHWAGARANQEGAQDSRNSPLRSPNPDTASQSAYNNVAGMGIGTNPQRRTWVDALTEGDKREFYGQGRPQSKDSSGAGANWYQGTTSDPPVSGSSVESRFFFEGTVSATDMSRATDAREKGRIGIFGTSNSYGGSYPRVTSEALGRDLNPLGRGSGFALVAGMLSLGKIIPRMPMSVPGGGRQGNSVNNPCGMGGGCGGGSFPGMDILRPAWAAIQPPMHQPAGARDGRWGGEGDPPENWWLINCDYCCSLLHDAGDPVWQGGHGCGFDGNCCVMGECILDCMDCCCGSCDGKVIRERSDGRTIRERYVVAGPDGTSPCGHIPSGSPSAMQQQDCGLMADWAWCSYWGANPTSANGDGVRTCMEKYALACESEDWYEGKGNIINLWADALVCCIRSESATFLEDIIGAGVFDSWSDFCQAMEMIGMAQYFPWCSPGFVGPLLSPTTYWDKRCHEIEP